MLNLIDLGDVYMTFFLPTRMAGRVGLGSEARRKPRYLWDRTLGFPPPDPTHDRLRRLSFDFQPLSENECISAIGQCASNGKFSILIIPGPERTRRDQLFTVV